jgi:D-sedoheptulose 7-phosphate isomerase
VSYTDDYLAAFQSALSGTEATSATGERLSMDACLDRLCRISTGIRAAGRTQFMCGNGASAAFANHMALDWSKNAGVRTLSFADAAMLTALGNDFGGSAVFAAALRMYADAGDLLVTISSSGNSPNIVTAIDEANRLGLTVVTFSGLRSDNRTRGRGTVNLYVPAKTYGIVESAHQLWLHAWLDRHVGVREWELEEAEDMHMTPQAWAAKRAAVSHSP